MTKKYRIGVAGLTHDHIWGNLENLAASSKAELAAVADPNQPLLDRVTEHHGCAAYKDHGEMMEQESLDIVYVFCDNAAGADVTVLAAEHGCHVMVEKPMAATLEGAERMIAATEKAGVKLMINWPVVWRPQVQAALDIVTRPEFGSIWQITHRAGHGGPEAECSTYFAEWILDPARNGAGAIVDLCAYGINMTQALLGRPQQVTAVGNKRYDPPLPVEDNAIVVMNYPKALATAEGVWGQVGQPLTGYLATIWGTNGSVTLGPGRGGRVWLTNAEHPTGQEISPPDPLPHMTCGTEHFVWALETGNELHPLCRPAVCRATQEVLDAAIKSADQGTTITLSSQSPDPKCEPEAFHRS